MVALTAADEFLKSNYQNFQRFTGVDYEISGDGAATLPHLVEAVKRAMTDDKKNAFADRGKKLALKARQGFLARAAQNEAALGLGCRDADQHGADVHGAVERHQRRRLLRSPTPRSRGCGYWAHKLWKMDKEPYHWLGDAGAYGVGYVAPAAASARPSPTRSM